MAKKTISISCFKAYDLRGLAFASFLLPENRLLTSRAVCENQADVGLAWDGDFNRRLADPQKAIATVEKHFSDREEINHRDDIDGLSLEFADWRFILRATNTEPLLRLNVESRGDRDLIEKKTWEILDLLDETKQ